MLEKVLCACTRLGLSSAAAQVARAVGMAALSAGALGLAASLLLRAGDTARLAAALQPLADAVEQALADQVCMYACTCFVVAFAIQLQTPVPFAGCSCLAPV